MVIRLISIPLDPIPSSCLMSWSWEEAPVHTASAPPPPEPRFAQFPLQPERMSLGYVLAN